MIGKTASNPARFLSCHAYGVGHGREGVCLLLRMGEHRILLDCGLNDISPLLESSAPPADLVFCSHAHADHARGLLFLHQHFPDLPIYGSEVTSHLLPLNWPEGQKTEPFCRILPWRSPITLSENLQIQLFPAGHLPGAAAIVLSCQTPQRDYTAIYTGDFCLSNSRLADGLSVESLRGFSPDVAIVEGSYGSARHPRRRQLEQQLMGKIHAALLLGHSVLLPVPTMGLAQEILMLLRSHHQFTGRDLDVWVDEEIGATCDIYLNILPHLPASVRNFASHQPLFWDDRVLPRVRRLPKAGIDEISTLPCVLLVDRRDRWQQYCQPRDREWTVLFPEYPGRTAMPHPELLEDFPNIALETYLLAEHSDGRNTAQLIHNIRPQHVLFVHGSPTYLADLIALEELQNRYQLHSPASGMSVDLPVGDRFIQPPPPTLVPYEGEIVELDNNTIQMLLPPSLSQSSHWRTFADTGLIEARWQGDELVLRGLTQRELLSQSRRPLPAIEENCENCEHQVHKRCFNHKSPLYGLQVTLQGCCPVFEPKKNE
ncbi:MAG: MBL fold metallo-hydrolase [Cyanobacteria bacterium P01_E01_bin.42]